MKHLGHPDYINFVKPVNDKISFGSRINEITSTSNININPNDTSDNYGIISDWILPF